MLGRNIVAVSCAVGYMLRAGAGLYQPAAPVLPAGADRGAECVGAYWVAGCAGADRVVECAYLFF